MANYEERYGLAEVEKTLDAAHALKSHATFRYPGKRGGIDLAEEERRERERHLYAEQNYNVLWSTLPNNPKTAEEKKEVTRRREIMGLPQENVLYFLEKYAPRLKAWQRELLRIVRNVAQYFYPQQQTQVSNEGCATYVHYKIINKLLEQERITDAQYLEFLHSHTGVVRQPEFDSEYFSGWNPYALGFSIMRDIERLVVNPTEEDREWFPEIAGTGDYMAVLRDVWANYRDESMISQFLSPKLMRDFRMFRVYDDSDEPTQVVRDIHNEDGYRNIRNALARRYDIAVNTPSIEVVDVDLEGDRKLKLQHRVEAKQKLNNKETDRVLMHLRYLWGYEVELIDV